jgi:CHAT domain-containing protein
MAGLPGIGAAPQMRFRDVPLVFVGKFLAKRPNLPVPMRWFFRRCPRLFVANQSLKAQTGHASTASFIASSHRCLEMAKRAGAWGYAEEAGALYITAARLFHNTHEFFRLADPSMSVRELNKHLVVAFEGLGCIEALPAKYRVEWQDQLAEAVGTLAFFVLAFPHEESVLERVLAAAVSVAAVVSAHAPYRGGSKARPWTLGHYYFGGDGAIQAQLAHTEIVGQMPEAAVRRLELFLPTKTGNRDDIIHALLVGIAAARRAKLMDAHTRFLGELSSLVEEDRTKYNSVEGRLFEMEELFQDCRRGTEPSFVCAIHHPEDLFAVSELLKARLMLDDLSGSWVPPSKPDLGGAQAGNQVQIPEVDLAPEQIRELMKLSHVPYGAFGGLAPNKDGFGVLGEMAKEAQAEHRRLDPARLATHGGFRGGAKPEALDEVRSALRDDELIIEYFLPRDPFSPNRDGYVIAMDRDRVECEGFYIDPPENQAQHMTEDVILERGPLSDMAARVRAAVMSRQDDAAREGLAALFDILVAPVIRMGFEPEQYRRWIFVPHGPLHLVPLHALIDPDGKYLIERVAITSCPSASVWRRMIRSQSPGTTRLLAVGNPALTAGSKHRPLRDAEDEVNRLAGCFAGFSASTVLTGLSATETRVKDELLKAEVLHFATHGELDFRDPRAGHRIVLRADARSDGALTAREVHDLTLPGAKLVVLNICDGAVCRYGPGDEPLGLVAAFIAAGAQNILGGLWELPDAASKVFILDFYRGLGSGSVATARQAAAKAAITKGRDLVFWAGFELVGPGREF